MNYILNKINSIDFILFLYKVIKDKFNLHIFLLLAAASLQHHFEKNFSLVEHTKRQIVKNL